MLHGAISCPLWHTRLAVLELGQLCLCRGADAVGCHSTEHLRPELPLHYSSYRPQAVHGYHLVVGLPFGVRSLEVARQDFAGDTRPRGLKATLALRSIRRRTVGRAALMRVSSATEQLLSSRGTLNSTLSSTRRPDKSSRAATFLSGASSWDTTADKVVSSFTVMRYL